MTAQNKKEGFTWLYRGLTLVLLPWILSICYGIYSKFEEVQRQVMMHERRLDELDKRITVNEMNDKSEHSMLFRELKEEKADRQSFNEKYIWNNPYFKINGNLK